MKKTNFNRDWSFSLNGEEAVTVCLPHDFSIDRERSATAAAGAAGGFFPGGYGVYEKTFAAKRGKKHFFFCDGSFGITEILINHNLVCINKYGYNSFYADLTEYLRYDRENVLTVRVNNKWQPNSRWYSGSGLYRDVLLCVSDASYLDPYGPFFYTEAIVDGTAYVCAEVRYFAAQRGEGTLHFEVFEPGKGRAVHTFTRHVYATEGANKMQTRFQLEGARIWDLDHPSLYRIRVTLTLGGSRDTEETVFGVRTVIADCKRGLLLNGRSVKLYGGCIHHDHGPLGAASYAASEYRRVAKLKEAGFNAVRLSHNPQSRHLYDACDRLGMLVIDELFDYWTDGKLKDDMHAFFDDNYLRWTEQIVLRNRCHPSVIMWSTGNEIPQKSGRGHGYEIARSIADTIRSLDTSRPLIHSFCSLWDDKEEYEQEKATNGAAADVIDFFADRISITADTVDVIGYNYLEYRLERDLVRFPDKLFLNTETYPLSAFTTYAQLKDNPRILGDFVWTAWDYFGETGIGHINYHYPEPDDLLADRHPNHIANCGDVDICGRRKHQSYYREIAWGMRKDPYISVTPPDRMVRPYSPSAWGFYDCEPSWCFRGQEGKTAGVYVFADCDEVTLSVNGREVGRALRNERGIYFFETPYETGELSATAWINGASVGHCSLTTEGAPASLCLAAEPDYAAKSAQPLTDTLIYVDVSLRDGEGAICTQGAQSVRYEATGAQILGVGNGHLTDLARYTDTERSLYRGRSVVILRPEAGNADIALTATADGLPMAEWRMGRKHKTR